MNYTVEELLALDAQIKKDTKKNSPIDWAAMYKEVTGKDLIYLPIEEAPVELQAAINYFANKEEE